MADEPLVKPKRKASNLETQPSELLFAFQRGAARLRCELRSQGAFGVEIRVYENDAIIRRRRFKGRALAMEWAGEQCTALEKGGA